MRNLLIAISILATSTLSASFANTEKLVAEAKKEITEITPSALNKMIENEEAIIVLDTREVIDRRGGEIYSDEYYTVTRGALEFEIQNKIKDKNIMIITYCIAGSSGALAAQTLKKLGYKKVRNLKGGIKAWAEAGYPIETGLGTLKITKDGE